MTTIWCASANVVVCDGTGAEDEQTLDLAVDVPAIEYRQQVVALAELVNEFFDKRCKGARRSVRPRAVRGLLASV
jgi:hypothetical protein